MAENKKELKIEIPPEVASGHYSNLAIITHSPNEFYIDFVSVAPNLPQARVQSRIIMTPENVKNLLFALRDNLQKYEKNFGEIRPRQVQSNNNDLPNPFTA